MIVHIVLHFVVPVIVAHLFYKEQWKQAALIMVLTMLVDLDHLLANPVFDPERCSIGFHPLHTIPAIGAYAILFALPLLTGLNTKKHKTHPVKNKLHLIGLGLLIHMLLDWIDCLY
ncbi:DUF6122 family protein [Fodinibius sp.]|uniref:DUF6122 family protein n=1 Tax=Fodinibius sp. TaxID=1872440 RepID=UPI0035659715